MAVVNASVYDYRRVDGTAAKTRFVQSYYHRRVIDFFLFFVLSESLHNRRKLIRYYHGSYALSSLKNHVCTAQDRLVYVWIVKTNYYTVVVVGRAS